ncbi:MAG: DUF2148 domain-containing protein [Nitrospirota bacterium]
MAIIQGPESENYGVRVVATLMCTAARTAPKAKGIDNIVTGLIDKQDKQKLVDTMREIAKDFDNETFARDADAVEKCPILVLIGTKLSPINLRLCGLCGFKDCVECVEKGGMCIFNPGDLGIAAGSAVAIAADNRVDNRIMYSAGFAAVKLKLLGEEVKIAYGIPLSATGKNIFFDRKT